MHVYQVIQSSGNKGIQNHEIKNSLGQVSYSAVTSNFLTKILKKLEKAGLIKSLKSIEANNRKVYMLKEYEPDFLP